VCGNGVVETGEDCDDGGTAPGDGCDAVCACEAGVCGDGDVNCGEQCDDGGTVPGDGCDAACQREAVAFRIADLYIRDPHFFALIADVLCTDITDMPLDQCGVNCQLNDSISMDADGDGYLDLNIMAVFRPLIQDVPMTRADFLVGECTVAKDCAPQFGGAVDTRDMFNTPAGGPNCLDPVAAHLHAPPYDPPVLSTPAHCVVSADAPLTLSFAGITLVFATAEIAATYNADPATNLMTGLIKGFITEADADSLVLPISLPFVGGKPLSQILVGGTMNCRCDHGIIPGGCQSDGPPLEVGPDGTTPGWWFYMNFTAEAVNWDENPVLPDAGP
jgi:cysteine-rich repeat protein